jgi:hypothetical protein
MKRWLVCVALIAWAATAGATIYKWVDGTGKVQYGDRPPDGVHAEVVYYSNNHRIERAATSTSNAANSSVVPRTSITSANERLADEKTRKAIQDDVEASRSKQCTEARERYQKYITSRRMFKEGKNGEREYLSDQEIEAERLNAKRDVDSVCNSST